MFFERSEFGELLHERTVLNVFQDNIEVFFTLETVDVLDYIRMFEFAKHSDLLLELLQTSSFEVFESDLLDCHGLATVYVQALEHTPDAPLPDHLA